MSGKIVMAAVAILLGSAEFARAQMFVFPQHSYWYGGGYYSPLTGTAVGIEPPYHYLPGLQARGYHNWDDGRWDHNRRTWRNQ